MKKMKKIKKIKKKVSFTLKKNEKRKTKVTLQSHLYSVGFVVIVL